MKLEQSFKVDAPLERVWAALVDVERVAPCLPGASVTGRNDDGTYNGTFTIKIGPTTASYAGKLEMQNIDEATHSATMHAQGSDKRGQGGATATIVSRLTPGDGQTRVEVVTDYHITGRLARFGRGGMIEDISERLLRDFARCLQSSLGSDGGAGTADQAAGAGAAAAAVGHGAGGPAAAGEAAAGEAGSIVPDDEAPTAVHEIVGPDDPAELPPTQAAPPPPPPPTEPEAPPPPTEAVPPPPPPAEPKAPPPPPPTPPHPPSDKSAEPLDGVALVGSILVDRVKRNPKPLVAAAGGLVLIGLLRRRR